MSSPELPPPSSPVTEQTSQIEQEVFSPTAIAKSEGFFAQIKDWWRKRKVPPRWRLTMVAVMAFALALALDFALAPLTPINRPLLTGNFWPEERVDRAPTVVRVEDLAEQLIDENTPLLGRPLTRTERELIKVRLGLPADFRGGFVSGPEVPMIILHDTAGILGREELENRPSYGSTPLGDGIAVYLPREGDAIFTRRVLFTPHRPTATAYERGFDFGSERQRNQALLQVWQRADGPTREKALATVIGQLDEPPPDLARRAQLWFTLGDRRFRQEFARSPRSLDGGKSTAIWTVGALCQNVLGQEDSSSYSPELRQACGALNPQLQASQARLATSFNVELVQKEGSDCFTSTAAVQAYNRIADPAHRISSGRMVPLASYSRAAYTDIQYAGLVNVYLQGAIGAGRFPQLVTHYWLDQGNGKAIGSHCDPRGLDINRLYREIAFALGHAPDTAYGPVPQYGLDPAAGDNVWWADEIMAGPPPSF